jgi:hypothetical protein
MSGRIVIAMLRPCALAATTPPATAHGKKIAWIS